MSTATERTVRAAHEAVERVADTMGRAEEKVRESLHGAGERLRDSKVHARDRGGEMADEVSGYIHEHPMMALGAAFAAGLILSSLLRR